MPAPGSPYYAFQIAGSRSPSQIPESPRRISDEFCGIARPSRAKPVRDRLAGHPLDRVQYLANAGSLPRP